MVNVGAGTGSYEPTDRRVVARHLNLCASARKELDEWMTGAKKPSLLPEDIPAVTAQWVAEGIADVCTTLPEVFDPSPAYRGAIVNVSTEREPDPGLATFTLTIDGRRFAVLVMPLP